MRPLVFIFQVTILFLILDGIVAPGTWRNRWNRLIHLGRENKKTETHSTQSKPKINHQTAASTKTSSTTAAHKPVVPLPPAQPRQSSNSPPNTGTHSHTHTQGTPNNTTAQKQAPPALVPIENVPSVQVSPPHPVQKEPEQQPRHTPADQQPTAEETKKDQQKQTDVIPGETTVGAADKATEKHGHLSAIPAEKENKTGTEGGGEDADKKVEVGEQKVETPREGHKHTGEAHETANEITGQADAPAHNTREHTGDAAAPLPVPEETGGHVPKPKTQTGAPAETPAEQHNGGAVSTNDKAPEVDAKAVEASGRK